MPAECRLTLNIWKTSRHRLEAEFLPPRKAPGIVWILLTGYQSPPAGGLPATRAAAPSTGRVFW